MDKNMIIWLVIILLIGIVIGFFVLPILIQSSTGIGEGVFGSSQGVSPPSLPP